MRQARESRHNTLIEMWIDAGQTAVTACKLFSSEQCQPAARVRGWCRLLEMVESFGSNLVNKITNKIDVGGQMLTFPHLMKGMLKVGRMLQTNEHIRMVVELCGLLISAQFTIVVFRCVFSPCRAGLVMMSWRHLIVDRLGMRLVSSLCRTVFKRCPCVLSSSQCHLISLPEAIWKQFAPRPLWPWLLSHEYHEAC